MNGESPALKANQIALLIGGPEGYGIGQIYRLMAMGMPGLLFVATDDGVAAQWLRDGGYRITALRQRFSFTAGSTGATLLVAPKRLWEARQVARRIETVLRNEGITHVIAPSFPQHILGGFLRQWGFKVAWQHNNNTNTRRLGGGAQKLQHLLARWGADLMLPASDFIGRNWDGSGVPSKTLRNCAVPLFEAPNVLPPSPVRCMIAGRLDATKGHHVVIAAVINAMKQGFEISLDIFGGPVDANPYADQLRKQIADAGAESRIRLCGYDTNLRARHQTYHLGFQARIDPEPCSVWVCETMVDGLPLIASATGGTPELVADGETGLLVPADDVPAATEALISLLRSPDRLAQMRVAAFERGKAHFTLDRFVRETMTALASIR